MEAQYVLAGCLIVLGIAHSMLGESGLLRPLFAADWTIGETPRWAADRILRFAWHLTSVAWFGLAAIVVGADALIAAGAMCLASAAIIFVMLRGHLAWPLFLLGGLAGLRGADALPREVLVVTTILTIALLGAAALLHVYWAAGGRWFLDRAVPPPENGFTPGPLLALAVAGALALFAVFVATVGFAEDAWTKWLVVAGVVVLAVRAIGDGRIAGFTKTDRSSQFAEDDDRYFTPLIVFLALGAGGALLL